MQTSSFVDANIIFLAIVDVMFTRYIAKKLAESGDVPSAAATRSAAIQVSIATMLTIGALGIRIATTSLGNKQASSVEQAIGVIAIVSALLNLLLSGGGLAYAKVG